MNTMDHAKVMVALERWTVAQYLQTLVIAPMHRITLFPTFAYSGAANTANPHYFVMIDDLQKIIGLNSGWYHN